MTTKAASSRMARVAQLPCILCKHVLGQINHAGIEVHHLLEGGVRVGHGATIPLCIEHHRGGTGVHELGVRGFERMYKTSELQLLNLTNLELENA